MTDFAGSNPQVISLREARALGLNSYFTGRPCKKGHMASRRMSGHCIACEAMRHRSEAYREANREWKKANQDKLRQYRKTYREANRKKTNETTRRWQRANPEKVRQIARRYYYKKKQRSPQ